MEMSILYELLWGPTLGAFLACILLARLLHRCEIAAPDAPVQGASRAAALDGGRARTSAARVQPSSKLQPSDVRQTSTAR